MSFFDIILGSFGSGPKIYRSAVLRIPGSRFNRQVRLKVGGDERSLVGESLRNYLAGLAGGGISFTSMEEKLKTAGLKGKQYERRKEIMATLREETQAKKEEEVNNKEDNILDNN